MPLGYRIRTSGALEFCAGKLHSGKEIAALPKDLDCFACIRPLATITPLTYD
jgi:hypothetical protein